MQASPQPAYAQRVRARGLAPASAAEPCAESDGCVPPAHRAPNEVGDALQPMRGVGTLVCVGWCWRWGRHGLPRRKTVGGTGPVVNAELVVAERVFLAVVVHCFVRARIDGQRLTRIRVCPRVATNSAIAEAVAYGGLVRRFTVYPMGAFAAQEGHGEEAVVESGS